MRYRMGDLVELVTETNSDLKYGLNDIVGVTLEKQMIPTIANLTQTDLDDFIIVHPKDFVYNPRTHGKKIGLGFNTTDRCFISTWNNNTFRVKPQMMDVIIPEFLYMHFLRDRWDKEACFNAWGSSTVVLLWSSFCDMKINVPPISEQRKIVHDYQVITDRIELLRKMNDNLMACCGVNYQVMLDGFTEESDKDVLPEGWTIGSIGSYCDLRSGYAFKSEWWTVNGFKVIKIANIVDNTIDLDSCDCVMDEHAKLAKLFYSVPGDIFIAMTGATTGKIGILPFCKEKVVVNQRVGKFSLGKEPIKKAPFLFATLLSPRVVRRLQPDGMAGSAQDNLSADDIKNVAIVVPDASTIEEFNTHNQSIIESIMTNDAELRLLQKLLGLLLSKMTIQKGA